jgi:hypothetical protein
MQEHHSHNMSNGQEQGGRLRSGDWTGGRHQGPDQMIRRWREAGPYPPRARGVPDRTVNRGESRSLTGTPQGR